MRDRGASVLYPGHAKCGADSRVVRPLRPTSDISGRVRPVTGAEEAAHTRQGISKHPAEANDATEGHPSRRLPRSLHQGTSGRISVVSRSRVATDG